jgi:hypothetical protein
VGQDGPEGRRAGGRRAYKQANLEKVRATQRAYYLANKERLDERQRAWRQENPERVKAYYVQKRPRARERKLERVYGLTAEDMMCMLAAQKNRCAVCGTPFALTKLNVDHCHRTGKVRGLLCGGCNRAAGQIGDDPERLRKLLAYVERHRRAIKV